MFYNLRVQLHKLTLMTCLLLLKRKSCSLPPPGSSDFLSQVTESVQSWSLLTEFGFTTTRRDQWATRTSARKEQEKKEGNRAVPELFCFHCIPRVGQQPPQMTDMAVPVLVKLITVVKILIGLVMVGHLKGAFWVGSFFQVWRTCEWVKVWGVSCLRTWASQRWELMLATGRHRDRWNCDLSVHAWAGKRG